MYFFSKPAADLPVRIGILLIPRFSMLCFSSTLEPLRAANRHAGRRLYDWTILSVSGHSVAASNGLEISVDRPLSAVGPLPFLFVCASFEPEDGWSPQVAAALRGMAARGTEVGGLDTGSFILARSGLLDGYKATVHWEELDALAERFPEVQVEPDLFVIDRDRVTAGGGTTSLDLMLFLIRVQHGAERSLDVASQFIYGPTRTMEDPQIGTAARQLARQNPNLAAAIELMESQVEEPMAIPDVARRAGISQRDLERLSQRYLKMRPAEYYRNLRLTQAYRLLRQTSLPVTEIGVRCGFNSPSVFARAFKRRFGLSPSMSRKSAA